MRHAVQVVPMFPNQTHQFGVSMHDLRVHLKMKAIITLLIKCFHDENIHVNCLPTSLLDHSVTTSKAPVIYKTKGPSGLVLGLAHNIKSCAFIQERKIGTLIK